MVRTVRLSLVVVVSLAAAACGALATTPSPRCEPVLGAVSERCAAHAVPEPGCHGSPPRGAAEARLCIRGDDDDRARDRRDLDLGDRQLRVRQWRLPLVAGRRGRISQRTDRRRWEAVSAGRRRPLVQHDRRGEGRRHRVRHRRDPRVACPRLRASAGRVRHHFTTEDGALTAASLDLDRPDTSGFSGAIELFADEQGTLVSVTVRARWQQTNQAGSADADASSVLELAVVAATIPSSRRPTIPGSGSRRRSTASRSDIPRPSGSCPPRQPAIQTSSESPRASSSTSSGRSSPRERRWRTMSVRSVLPRRSDAVERHLHNHGSTAWADPRIPHEDRRRGLLFRVGPCSTAGMGPLSPWSRRPGRKRRPRNSLKPFS